MPLRVHVLKNDFGLCQKPHNVRSVLTIPLVRRVDSRCHASAGPNRQSHNDFDLCAVISSHVAFAVDNRQGRINSCGQIRQEFFGQFRVEIRFGVTLVNAKARRKLPSLLPE